MLTLKLRTFNSNEQKVYSYNRLIKVSTMVNIMRCNVSCISCCCTICAFEMDVQQPVQSISYDMDIKNIFVIMFLIEQMLALTITDSI